MANNNKINPVNLLDIISKMTRVQFISIKYHPIQYEPRIYAAIKQEYTQLKKLRIS